MPLNKFQQSIIKRNSHGFAEPTKPKSRLHGAIGGVAFAIMAFALALLLYPFIAPTILPLFLIATIAAVIYGGVPGAVTSTIAGALLVQLVWYFHPEHGGGENIIGRIILMVVIAILASRMFLARLQVEAVLIDSETRVRKLSDNHADGIVTIDQNSIVYYANRAMVRMFGYEKEEIVGGNLNMIMPDYLKEVHNIAVKRYMDTGVRHVNWDGVEVMAKRKDGSEFPIEVSFGEFEQHGIKFFSGFIRDISGRKKIEDEKLAALQEAEKVKAELIRAKEESEEANNAKDHFLAALSHELRTPLSSILGYANMLASGKVDEKPEAMKIAIDTIQKNARLQADMIEDLLDVSRIISGKLALKPLIVGLPSLVQQVCTALKPMADEKHITIECNCCTEKKLFVNGDPQRLIQVFSNIMNNAIKFTQDGGHVQVRVVPNGLEVDVEIIDNGAGINPEFIPHLFGRFQQDERLRHKSRGGLGLGLSIVRTLTEMHGGRVKAHSEGEGKGSAFTVTLPLSSPPVDEPTVRRTATEDLELPSLKGTKVLLIDDDEDTLTMLRTVLERYGAIVKTADSADNARTALQTVESYDSIPDVIICDIGMPREDGLTFMSKLRSSGNNVPAISLTAFSGDEYAKASEIAGFQLYLIKPIEIEHLIRSVREVSRVEKVFPDKEVGC